MRVFLDTNVVASALGTRGLCSDVLHTALTEHDLVIGETVLHELPAVLTTKFGLSRSLAEEATAFLRRRAEVLVDRAAVDVELRDPSDVPILAEALAGSVDVLVTGDRDLLDIARSVPIRILGPRGFWELLRQG